MVPKETGSPNNEKSPKTINSLQNIMLIGEQYKPLLE